MCKKQDGFRDEKYYIIPTELFAEYIEHPMIRCLYLTDVGFFPNAKDHYREREDGADQNILIYCMDGFGTIEIEDRKYDMRPGTAMCIPKRRKHLYYADKDQPWTILWMHFLGENEGMFPVTEEKIVKISSNHARNRLQMQFEMLFRVLERNYTLGNYIYISQLATLILTEIYFREKVEDPTTYDRHVTKVIQYMLQNLKKNLTLGELSRETELSKSYLNAIFQSQTGHSPIEFFIRLKMQEACKLLKSTDLYIYEVSARMGYEDQYYFSRLFHKIVGMSPKDYKNGDYFYHI